MTNPQNLEPRVIELRSAASVGLEIDMADLKQSVSDLQSTVATQQEAEAN